MSTITPKDVWQDAVRQTRGMKATWPLDTRLEVGTFGYVNADGAFAKQGTLTSKFGLDIDLVESDHQDVLAWKSEGVDSSVGRVHGDLGQVVSAVAKAGVGAELSFRREGAIAYRFEGVSLTAPKDEQALLANIAELGRPHGGDARLGLHTVVVSQVARAERGFVLVAIGRNASAAVTLSAEIAPTAFPLASTDVDVQLANCSEGLLPFTGKAITPFFRGYEIRRRFGFLPQKDPGAYGYTGYQPSELYLANLVTDEEVALIGYHDERGGRTLRAGDEPWLDETPEWYDG